MRLAAAVALVAATVARAAAAPVDLRVPARIVLGRDGPPELSYRAQKGRDVRLAVNVGALEPAKPAAGGRLVARYQPPARRVPQRALVVAYDAKTGEVLERRELPLYGEAQLDVTSDPLTEVTAKVGDASFGPVRTNARGEAVLDLVVPPGLKDVTLVARGGSGKLRERRVPLEVPEPLGVAALCPERGDRVVLVTTGAVAAAQLEVAVTPPGAGTLGALVAGDPGVYTAPLTVADGAPPGVGVTVRQKGVEAAAACTFAGAEPTDIAVEVTPSHWSVGRGPVEVRADVSWPAGRPRAAARVKLEPTLGTISAPVETSPGRWRASWTLPDALKGAIRARVRASTDARLPLRAEAELTLGAGGAQRLVLAAPGDAVADGRTPRRLRVTLLDAFGNPVREAALEARAGGRVGTFRVEPDGAHVASYVGPRRREARGLPRRDTTATDTVAVRDAQSGLTARAPVRLRIGPRRFEAALRLGWLGNFAKVSAPVVLADLTVRLPLWRELPFVSLQTGFWISSTEQLAAEASESVTVDVRAVPVWLRAGAELPLGWARPYVAALAGLAWAETALSSPRAGAVVEQGATWAVGGVAGAAVRLGPGRLALEVAYVHAPLDRASARGNVAGLSISVGYGVDFE